MTDENDDGDGDGGNARSEAIRGAIAPQSESESQSESQTQSQSVEQTESQSQEQSQTQSVMESLGVDPGEDDLKTSRKHVNMYLDETLAEALDARFDEVNALHRKQQGYEIEKNRDFYPALIEAAFRDDASILDVLDLDT